MVKIGYFSLRQNGRFLTKNGVSKKKSKKAQKIDEKGRLWTRFLGFFLIFWKFGQNRLCCPKGQNSLFFTIFFNFFHILGYLEGAFCPTGPRNPILGAGFTRGCPGNGLMLKKLKTGQNFTRESDPLPPPPPSPPSVYVCGMYTCCTEELLTPRHHGTAPQRSAVTDFKNNKR